MTACLPQDPAQPARRPEELRRRSRTVAGGALGAGRSGWNAPQSCASPVASSQEPSSRSIVEDGEAFIITRGPCQGNSGGAKIWQETPASENPPPSSSHVRPAQYSRKPSSPSKGVASFQAVPGAIARARHAFAFMVPSDSAGRATISTFSKPSSSTASSRNPALLWFRSTRVRLRSGRAIDMGIPGSPAPDPTSTTRPRGTSSRAPRRESTTCRSQIRPRSRFETSPRGTARLRRSSSYDRKARTCPSSRVSSINRVLSFT